VGGLVQRVQRQPALGVGDRRLPAPPDGLGVDQPLQRARPLPAQRVGLGELPVLELRGVPQGEAGEEVAAVQRDRLGERLGALGAGPFRLVAVRVAARHQGAEAPDVQLHARRDQLQPAAVRGDPGGAAEGVVQRGERAPQRGARVGVVRLRPQQRGQLVAPVAAAAARQVGEQRDRLAGVDPQRRAAHLHARRPEQRQPQCSHVPRPCSPGGCRFAPRAPRTPRSRPLPDGSVTSDRPSRSP
jgi:hypothetical protein